MESSIKFLKEKIDVLESELKHEKGLRHDFSKQIDELELKCQEY